MTLPSPLAPTPPHQYHCEKCARREWEDPAAEAQCVVLIVHGEAVADQWFPPDAETESRAGRPKKGETPVDVYDLPSAREAIATCWECPVRETCLEAAMAAEGTLSRYGRHGIWGGTTPVQRAAMGGYRDGLRLAEVIALPPERVA